MLTKFPACADRKTRSRDNRFQESNMSGPGDGMTDSVANIAGAIADAMRESLQRTLNPQPQVAPGSQNPRPSASPRLRKPPTSSNVGIGSLYERVSAVG